MTGPFSFGSDPEVGREPKHADRDDATADEVFDALDSETARTLLLELHAEHRPASELAEAVDTTVENVQTHLAQLEAAGLVTDVETRNGGAGSKDTVYAPAEEALVLFADDRPEGSDSNDRPGRLVGAVTVLAAVAVVLALAAGEGGADTLVVGLSFFGGGVVALAGLALVDLALR